MDTKNPLHSLTIRGLIGVILGVGVTQFGLPLDVEVLTEDVTNLIGMGIQLVGLVAATIGRWRATLPLA